MGVEFGVNTTHKGLAFGFVAADFSLRQLKTRMIVIVTRMLTVKTKAAN